MTLHIQNVWLPDQGLVDLQIQEGRISALSPDLSPLSRAVVIDGRGMAVVPGLVNGHTHAGMSLFRGYGDDMPLMEWLQTRIWPAEAKLTDEDVYWGSRLACLEMIRSGTVQFQDMFWQFLPAARAVEDAGLRAGVGTPMIDVAGLKQAEDCRRKALESHDQARDFSDRIRHTITPHAIYTNSEESLRWVAQFSEERQTPIHIHLSETAGEVADCLKKQGIRPAHYLDRLGLLNERTQLAHGVFLDDAELDLIARRGALLITNPVSNMKLTVGGVFPYARAAQRGIAMALGTDSAASNNSLDLFQELKTFALIQKHAAQDPTLLPAREAWGVATGAKAPMLGQSGQIAVGEKADFLLLRRGVVELTPEHDFISNLVYAATGHVVDTVVVNGQILMQDRQIPGEEEILREASERAKRLCDSD
ncbi:MAG: amidohydrolase [Magnetococcales bacterium]|nr:amidohydrolase [Magnetococcales bacterium]